MADSDYSENSWDDSEDELMHDYWNSGSSTDEEFDFDKEDDVKEYETLHFKLNLPCGLIERLETGRYSIAKRNNCSIELLYENIIYLKRLVTVIKCDDTNGMPETVEHFKGLSVDIMNIPYIWVGWFTELLSDILQDLIPCPLPHVAWEKIIFYLRYQPKNGIRTGFLRTLFDTVSNDAVHNVIEREYITTAFNDCTKLNILLYGNLFPNKKRNCIKNICDLVHTSQELFQKVNISLGKYAMFLNIIDSNINPPVVNPNILDYKIHKYSKTFLTTSGETLPKINLERSSIISNVHDGFSVIYPTNRVILTVKQERTLNSYTFMQLDIDTLKLENLLSIESKHPPLVNSSDNFLSCIYHDPQLEKHILIIKDCVNQTIIFRKDDIKIDVLKILEDNVLFNDFDQLFVTNCSNTLFIMLSVITYDGKVYSCVFSGKEKDLLVTKCIFDNMELVSCYKNFIFLLGVYKTDKTPKLHVFNITGEDLDYKSITTFSWNDSADPWNISYNNDSGCDTFLLYNKCNLQLWKLDKHDMTILKNFKLESDLCRRGWFRRFHLYQDIVYGNECKDNKTTERDVVFGVYSPENKVHLELKDIGINEKYGISLASFNSHGQIIKVGLHNDFDVTHLSIYDSSNLPTGWFSCSKVSRLSVEFKLFNKGMVGMMLPYAIQMNSMISKKKEKDAKRRKEESSIARLPTVRYIKLQKNYLDKIKHEPKDFEIVLLTTIIRKYNLAKKRYSPSFYIKRNEIDKTVDSLDKYLRELFYSRIKYLNF